MTDLLKYLEAESRVIDFCVSNGRKVIAITSTGCKKVIMDKFSDRFFITVTTGKRFNEILVFVMK